MIPRRYRRLAERTQQHLPKILSITAGIALIGVVYTQYQSHITSVAADASNAVDYHMVNLVDLDEKLPLTPAIYVTPKIVNLKIKDATTSNITFTKTLSEFITEQGIVLGEHDEVLPSLAYELSEQNNVEVVYVQKQTYILEESVAFKTKEVENPNIEDGVKTVKQEGKTGKIAKTYEKTIKNDTVVGEKLISQTVLVQPQDKIIEIGTKLVPKTELINGVTITYYKKLWVWSTSYDGNCLGCNGSTATGATLKHGIIAADPKVIPWHTKMYVPGYGFGQMEDTGGSLKKATTYGKIHIDLGFEDVSKGWWSARYTWVYLLVD